MTTTKGLVDLNQKQTPAKCQLVNWPLAGDPKGIRIAFFEIKSKNYLHEVNVLFTCLFRAVRLCFVSGGNMKNKVQELVELIEAQELDDTEIVYDNPVIERKTGVVMKYFTFTSTTPPQPIKKYSPEQIKALEAQMKAQGKL